MICFVVQITKWRWHEINFLPLFNFWITATHVSSRWNQHRITDWDQKCWGDYRNWNIQAESAVPHHVTINSTFIFKRKGNGQWNAVTAQVNVQILAKYNDKPPDGIKCLTHNTQQLKRCYGQCLYGISFFHKFN